MLRAVCMTSASLVNSSMTFSSFSALPSAVSSNWKSNAHMWSGALRAQELLGRGGVAEPRRLRVRRGTCRPSSRQTRCTRLRLIS
jgi:hypothetical protein